MSLNIGRVGLDVAIDAFNGGMVSWTETNTFDGGRRVTVRGWLQAGTIGEANALRSELLEQQGKLIACTYSVDASFDAFFYLSDVRIDSVEVSYRRRIFRFEIELIRAGHDAHVELQSLITGAPITNDHSMPGDLWWAAPPGALAISTGDTSVIEFSRASEDGSMGVFLGVSTDDDPSWSIPPASYYDGAVKVYTAGRLRAGQDFQNDPANWELNNGIVRFRPVTFGGSSTGRFDINFHNGSSWGTDIRFKIRWTDTVDIPAWHYMTCIRNDPEICIIRIVRDAETSPPSAERHVLDVQLRRGAPFVACYYTYTGAAATHAVARDSSDAATAGNAHIRDTGTIGGHRWVLGSPKAYAADTTNGKITMSVAAKTMPFFIGAAIDDAADGSRKGPTDITNQYIGMMGETVRAVKR